MKSRSLFAPVFSRLLIWLAVAIGGVECDAQLTQTLQLPRTTTQPLPAKAAGYEVAQVGPHSLVWRNSAGQTVNVIGTGMNYWDGQQWMESDPSFQISPNRASFIAPKLLAPIQLAANLNSQGAVTVTTPDNVILRSTPIAIGLYDAASGQSVVVAALTNTIGVMIDPQHVVYTNAFIGGGFAASVVYSLPDTGSFHQDVVFTGFNPNFDPTVWGFAATSASTLQIQIFTEFYNPPQPVALERPLYVEQDANVRASMASPDFIDYSLDFGHYVFGPGRAYTSSTYSLFTPGISVAKDFATSDGRTFLVESIPYRNIASQLQSLPPVSAKPTSYNRLPGAKRMRVAAASLPQLQTPKSLENWKIKPAKAVAMNSVKPSGVDIDYIVTLSSLSDPTIFTSDTTYFLSTDVYLSSPTTIESAVFKFPTNMAGALIIDGPLTLTTTNYRPAIFTAGDDNTAGSPLSTSIWADYTGTVSTNYYGFCALYFDVTTNIDLHNLRFNYLYTAVAGTSETVGPAINLSHSQLVNVSQGIGITGANGSDSIAFNINNCLFAHVRAPFIGNTIKYTNNVCNCTIDSTSLLAYMVSASGTLNFTNSLLSGVGNGVLGSVSLGGGNNGFWGTTTFGSSPHSTSISPFEWTWAGFYYLTNGTPFATDGITNIDPALLAQLQVKTTQIPMNLNSPHFTMNTVLPPVVQRDTAGVALGFHYDPIDYIGACVVSNATLTLAPGVAIAYYANCLTWLQDGGKLISQGAPNQRNYIVYYGQVQEQSIGYFSVPNFMAQLLPFVALPVGSSANPVIDLCLTTICAPTGQTNLWSTADFGGGQVISGLTLQDCEVYGSGATWQMSESANTPTVGLVNNVFHRVPFAISSNAKITSVNNLFYGTTNANEFAISMVHRSGAPSPNTSENNVFDGVAATLDGVVGYNAYVNGATNTSFTNNHDIVTNFAWQAGPLGGYYQPATSPLLANGSTYATNLGLCHYTVLTNEVVDGANIVSRGYHYVGLGANGLPLDTNNDGIPDYLEDANGNGAIDSGEIDWQAAGDLGLAVIITQPANNSTIP